MLIGAEWRAWLTDFGIATSSGESGLTEAGFLLGSPSYMSPERARNEVPSPAVDVWSLGATLFTAVEGRPPFDRGDAMSTLLSVTEPPAPILAAGPLTPVLLGCLTKDPARRMTVDQVRAGLNRVVLMGPAPAMTRPPEPPPTSYVHRQPTKVERMDVADLSALAKATRSLASKAAQKVAGSGSAGTHVRPPSSVRGPVNPPMPPGPTRQPAQPAPQRAEVALWGVADKRTRPASSGYHCRTHGVTLRA